MTIDRKTSSNYVSFVDTILNWIGKGEKCFQIRHVINVHKGSTIFVLYMLMHYFQNFSFSAYLYLSIHGSYGLLWILKDQIFPDPNWEAQISTFSSIVLSLKLLCYWAAGFIIIAYQVDITPERAFLVIFLHTLGCVMMMASDTQKYFTLKYRKGLIDEGWFARCRNTNYLGEVTLYASYAIAAQHWIPWVVNITIWLVLFLSNMLKKEKSLSQKSGGKEYFAKSWMFIPNFYGWIKDSFIQDVKQ